jgi:Ni/Co efflux regulator RcnB
LRSGYADSVSATEGRRSRFLFFGDIMKKKLIIIAAVAAFFAPFAAHAQSARSQECMAKNGFTAEQWRARTVPSGPAQAYRKCVQADGRALATEPPPGTLATGEVVYVSCGDGKKRKVTGGDTATGAKRAYGECR